MVKSTSRQRTALYRQQKAAGTIVVMLKVSANRIAEMQARGELPADFGQLSLAEKKEVLRKALGGLAARPPRKCG